MSGGNFNGPTNYRTNGGLGKVAESKDGVGALVCGGVAASGLALDEILECNQLSDAEDVGITASFDSTNGILVHHHIKRFFKISPDGKLYLKMVAQGTSMTDMCDHVANPDIIYEFIKDEATKREIKFLGVVLNEDMGSYIPALTGGFDGDVLTAIPKAQALVDQLETENINVSTVVIEGREMNGTLASLTDLSGEGSRKVRVTAGQDPVIAALDAAFANYAAVGDELGSISVRKVNECVGSTDIANKPRAKKANATYPLTDAAAGEWESAALSSGQNVNELSADDKQVLADKHIGFMGYYEPNLSEIFINDDKTCIDATDDYCRISANRVWDKASTLVRLNQLPRMNGEVLADTTTGAIDPVIVSAWETDDEKALQPMVDAGEISGKKVKLESSEGFLSGTPIKTRMRIVPIGIAGTLENYIGFATTLNA